MQQKPTKVYYLKNQEHPRIGDMKFLCHGSITMPLLILMSVRAIFYQSFDILDSILDYCQTCKNADPTLRRTEHSFELLTSLLVVLISLNERKG